MSTSPEQPIGIVITEANREILLALVREAMTQDSAVRELLEDTEIALKAGTPATMGAEDALPQVCTALQILTEAVEDAAPHIEQLEKDADGKMQLAGTLEAAAADARDILDAWQQAPRQPEAPTPAATPMSISPAPRRPHRI